MLLGVALTKVATGDYRICDLCKDAGKKLHDCLIKMKEGEPSNGKKHIDRHHKVDIAKIEKEREERAAAAGLKVCINIF